MTNKTCGYGTCAAARKKVRSVTFFLEFSLVTFFVSRGNGQVSDFKTFYGFLCAESFENRDDAETWIEKEAPRLHCSQQHYGNRRAS